MEDNATESSEPGSSGGQGNRLTFMALIVEGRKRGARDGAAATAVASNEAALRNLMRTHRLQTKDTFVALLGVQDARFESILEAYEEKTTLSAETVPAYRNRLRAWNLIARSLVQEHAPAPGLFAEVLREALDAFLKNNPDINRTGIVELAGTTLRRLYRWTTPGDAQTSDDPRNVAAATRLESILGIATGSLTSKLVPRRRKGRTRKEIKGVQKARQPVVPRLSVIRFRPESLPGRIGEFFERFATSKTTPRILRDAAGASIKRPLEVWRVLPGSDQPVPSKMMMEGRFRSYVGWLLLPDTLDGAEAHVAANCRWKKRILPPAAVSALAPFFMGKAIPAAELTPAHLVDPDLIGEFIEWHKNRNGSVTAQCIRDAIALMVPERGFLSQQVECAWDHPRVDIRPVDMSAPGAKQAYAAAAEAWVAKCAIWTRELAELFPFTSVGNSHAARNRLKPILDQKDIMAVVSTIIDNHAADRPVGKLTAGWSGSVVLAIWVRDQLLLRMLASNPLRNRNFREMRYLDNPTQQDPGNLYRGVDRGWRLLFQPADFKNEKGAAKETYDVAVPEALHPLVDLYLTRARPILMRAGVPTDKVFLTRAGMLFTTGALSQVVASLTGRYVQDDIDSLGFRTHAFRHIIATAWLRAHPKDYLTVAHILHDTLQTVLDNYGHHKPNDGLDLYTDWLATKMAPLHLSMAA